MYGPSGQLGHLVFNPVRESNTVLFTSSSLFPIFYPRPRLCLSRFLETSSPSSSLPPYVASSIAAYLGPYTSFPWYAFSCNRLQLLRCPNNVVLIFFATGENFDKVGYFVLSVNVSSLEVSGCGNATVIAASNRFNHPIILLLAKQAAEFGWGLTEDCDLIGYLMACTRYSVLCFKVRYGDFGLEMGKPVIEHLGRRKFSCAVVHACFSPHTPGESVVLLENGDLFLFDMNVSIFILRVKYQCTRLKVSWSGYVGCDMVGWLSCAYSWHPRIYLVARSDGVFLLDLRCEKCTVVCLVKSEVLQCGSTLRDGITAFSSADSDGFVFFVATNKWLFCYDIRTPMIPKMQWMHAIRSPFIEVLSLSNIVNWKYKGVFETGFCVIIGSLWNCEFGCFCYAPSAADVSHSLGFLCRWGVPSDLVLLGRNCLCGNCITRNDLSGDVLPTWVDWQQKSELVVSFGILSEDLVGLLDEPDSIGGFVLIKLMSSGKLELQKYRAAWLFEEAHHSVPTFKFGESIVLPCCDSVYKFPKRFKHMKFDFLNEHLNNNLMKFDFEIRKCSSLSEICRTFISKSPQKSAPTAEGAEIEVSSLFDGTCPVKLKFECEERCFGKEELRSYKLLRSQFLKWQRQFPLREKFNELFDS